MKSTLKIGTIFLSGLLAGAISLPVLGAAGKELRDRAEAKHPGIAAWRAKTRGPQDGGRPENPPPPGALALGGVGAALEHSPLGGALKALFPFWQDAEIASQLGLTDTQVSQLEESWKLVKAELESSEGNLREIGEDLREELQKDSPDLNTVNGFADQFTNDLNAKGKAILGHAVTVKTVLTAEQEEQVKGLIRKALESKREALGDLRDEIRESFQNGGTMEDAEAIIDASDLGEPYETIAKNMLHRRAENHGPNGRPDAPPPPPVDADE